MRRHRAHVRLSDRRGFTLLELLIATAVGAVVLLVIQTTFFGALRLHNTTHARIEADRVLERTLGLVRRDFAGLMLPGGTLTGQFQTSEFSSTMAGIAGERVTPDFVTTSGRIDGWSPFSEAQRVAYYLTDAEAGSNTKTLTRVVYRNLLPVQEDTPEETPLLPGVAAASVLYYDGAGWTDFWDSEVSQTLPTAVKFSLTMAAAPGSPAPAPFELIVPIAVLTTTSQTEAADAAAGL